MPRYDVLDVTDVKLINNTPPIRSLDVPVDFSKLDNYANLSADAKLTWSGDIIFDESTGDLGLSYTVESYVQRLYHRLITQTGEFPESSTFGWNFEYLFQLTVIDQQKFLNKIIRDIRDAVYQDGDTLSVINVTAKINQLDSQSHTIEIELTVRPKSINDVLQVTFQMNPSPQGGTLA